MKLTYTKVERQTPTSCYIIKIKYEHGDADSYTYDDVTLRNIDEAQFIRYLLRFGDVQANISDHNHYGRKYDQDLDTEMRFEGFPIPLEYDHHHDDSFACMFIENISFFDAHGLEFKVTTTY